MSFTEVTPPPFCPQPFSSQPCEPGSAAFAHAGIEPRLDEVYQDDGVRALMRRDRVTPEVLRQVVAATQRRLAQSRR
jgi:hypothetical protein